MPKSKKFYWKGTIVTEAMYNKRLKQSQNGKALSKNGLEKASCEEEATSEEKKR